MNSIQRQEISIRTESRDDALGEIGEIGVLAERFPCMDVGQMHFNKGNPDSGQGIAQGDAGVGEGRRVDDDVCNALTGRFLNGIDQYVFGVALQAAQSPAPSLRARLQLDLDLSEGSPPIMVGLTATQQVQVRSMQYKDMRR